MLACEEITHLSKLINYKTHQEDRLLHLISGPVRSLFPIGLCLYRCTHRPMIIPKPLHYGYAIGPVSAAYEAAT